MEMVGRARVSTVFTKSWGQLMDRGRSWKFCRLVLTQANWHNLLSEERFYDDGIPLEDWAAQRRAQPKDLEGRGGASYEIGYQKRTNEPAASQIGSDVEPLNNRPVESSRVVYLRQVLMGNRHELIIEEPSTVAADAPEVGATVLSIDGLDKKPCVALSIDNGHDRVGIVHNPENHKVHANMARRRKDSTLAPDCSAPGLCNDYARPRCIESISRWKSDVKQMRNIQFRSLAQVGMHLSLVTIAYNAIHTMRLKVFR